LINLGFGFAAAKVGPHANNASQDDAIHPFSEHSSDEDEIALHRRQGSANDGSSAQMGSARDDTGLEILAQADGTSSKPATQSRLQSTVVPAVKPSAGARRPSQLQDLFSGLRHLKLVPSTLPVPPVTEQPDQVGTFETPDLKATRRWLRCKPEIRTQVTRLWETARKENNKMSKAEYLDYHLSACRVLVQEYEDAGVFDESVEWETALADFREDARGKTALTFNLFFESVFERPTCGQTRSGWASMSGSSRCWCNRPRASSLIRQA
jgi:hypothetical protein